VEAGTTFGRRKGIEKLGQKSVKLGRILDFLAAYAEMAGNNHGQIEITHHRLQPEGLRDRKWIGS
jgi:hypothetical protein